MRWITAFALFIALNACSLSSGESKRVKVLIVDGQNNHGIWPKSTALMKKHLEQTGRFEVEVYRTRYTWMGEQWLAQYPLRDGKTYQGLKTPKTDPEFAPEFKKYDVVISNFGWRTAPWPKRTRDDFEQYMKNGGGFVSVHAANNAFPDWPQYNKMIGLGGWGERNEKDGPYVYFDQSGQLQRDHSKGQGGGHGVQHTFTIDVRQPQHPILQSMPLNWQHSRDELYNRLRGPAENLSVLASAYDDKKYKGFGRHEPVLMTIKYHRGRVFHTTLGHGIEAFEDPNFLTILARGTQWAATGDVKY